MTIAFSVGGYDVRFANSAQDLRSCQELRHLCFLGAPGREADRFDPLCRHLMVTRKGKLAATCRVMIFETGAQIDMSYTAQAYDLEKFFNFKGRLLEIGRFCVSPDIKGPDVLRICWGALAQIVDKTKISLVFGCTSFKGTEADAYTQAFGLLADRYLAPDCYQPQKIASEIVELKPQSVLDMRSAVAELPPLLRSYLAMGAWVSDHAVVDRALDTLHVFTGLETSAISPSRSRALLAVSQAA